MRHEFTKLRNIKREMDLMCNLCSQFNKVTAIKNISNDRDLRLRQTCQWPILTEFKKYKN